jgi:hypothetical protein
MLSQTAYNDAHTQFGIDEVYIHCGLDFNLLKKLQQRAEITLDGTDAVVQKNVIYDMVLIFHKKVQSRNMVYRFLQYLHSNPNQEKDFKESHMLLNVEELFEAIKSKKFVLVTATDISTEV